jgi:Short C-terminal domain/Phospholipase_D-nuclease N-terminal
MPCNTYTAPLPTIGYNRRAGDLVHPGVLHTRLRACRHGRDWSPRHAGQFAFRPYSGAAALGLHELRRQKCSGDARLAEGGRRGVGDGIGAARHWAELRGQALYSYLRPAIADARHCAYACCERRETWSRLRGRPSGNQSGMSTMFFFQEGFTYRNFLMDALAIFVFIVWFWLLISVCTDLFRRSDISGWGKAAWVIGFVLFSYLGVLAYLIFHARGMAERNTQRAEQARDELRRVVGYSVADELDKLDRLKKSGAISDAEFTRLRTRLVQ